MKSSIQQQIEADILKNEMEAKELAKPKPPPDPKTCNHEYHDVYDPHGDMDHPSGQRCEKCYNQEWYKYKMIRDYS